MPKSTTKELVSRWNTYFKDWIENNRKNIAVINCIHKLREKLTQFQSNPDCVSLVESINRVSMQGTNAAGFPDLMKQILQDIYCWDIYDQKERPEFDEWLTKRLKKDESGYDTEPYAEPDEEDVNSGKNANLDKENVNPDEENTNPVEETSGSFKPGFH